MNKSNNKNNNKKTINFQPKNPVKIYFPTIPIDVLENAIFIKSRNQTQLQPQSQSLPLTKIDKYLHSQKNKTIIIGTTCILEIVNNEPYNIYPVDKVVKSSFIHTTKNKVNLLLDYSNIQRSHTPSYQVPYEFKLHSTIVKTYKLDAKSLTSLVIEYKNNRVYDFYMLMFAPEPSTNLYETQNNINNNINNNNYVEIDNFVKEDIISFLFTLNLY